MIDVNGYYIDFKKSLNDMLFNKNVSIVEINIISEIFSLIENPDFYILPQHIEDYEYNLNSHNSLNLEKTIIIETEIESYERSSKNTKIKTFTPTIYICIKEKEHNFKNLNLLINSKFRVRDNIVLVIRKHNGVWQIPPIAFNIEEERLNIVEIFKNKYFEFQQSQKLINIKDCINTIIKQTHLLHKNNISILNSRQVDLAFYENKGIHYQIPTFLFIKKRAIDPNIQTLRIENDNLYKGLLDDLYYFGVKI